MRISTNVPSMVALRRLQNVSQTEQRESTRLSSGDRIYQSALDPAGLAISEVMKARQVSMGQAIRNVNDGISILQVTEGTLHTIQGIGVRLKELAMQSATDTVALEERGILDKEFQGLIKEIDRLKSSTEYNGRLVLSESGNKSDDDLQVGIHNDAKADRVGYDLQKILKNVNRLSVDHASISTKQGAQKALGQVDNMIFEISAGRAQLGSVSTKMEAINQNLQISRENLASSRSKIRDADVAKVTADRAIASVQKDAAAAMLKITSNRPTTNVAKLLE